MRGVSAHRGRARRCAGAAAEGQRVRGELGRVRGDRAAAGGRLRRARRRPRRHGRVHAGQPPRPAPLRRRRDAPRRRLLLGLQHVLAGAGRVPGRRRRQPGDRHRAGVPRAGAGGARAGADAGARGRRRRRAAGGDDLARRAGGDGGGGVRLRGRLARGRARGRALPDLHLGHHRAAQGGAADPRQHGRRVARLRPGLRDRAGRAQHLLPALGPRRRPLEPALRADVLRHLRLLLPRPARDGRLLDRGAADLLGRGAADLGKTEGGAGDGDGGRGRPGAAAGDRAGAAGRPPQGRRLHGG